MRYSLLIPALLLAQDPTIRVSTRLVQVNVVVRDAHGPVSGLTRNNFKIFDKGKEQQIALFNASASSSKPDAANPITPIPAGVFTNRPKSRTAEPTGATVLLIDVLNTEVTDQQLAQKQILKFLASLTSNRRVAVYLLGRRIRVLQDFTDDPTLLQKAVAKFRGQPSGALAAATAPTPGGGPTIEEENDSPGGKPDATTYMMRESLGEMRDAANIDRVGLTLATLEQIGNHLAQVPGRKSLIWISSSFPFYLINDERHNFMAANRENRTFSQETDQASRSLSAADVAIYPVDARGLLGAPDFDVRDPGNAFVNPRGRQFGTKGNGQLGAMSIDTPEGLESMQALAEGTGGHAYYNTNDINGAIGKAMSDADMSYTLAFYADSSAADGFHEIRVKVDRPNLDVRYRKGYLAAPTKPPTENDVASILRNTAANALDSTTIGLVAAMDSSRVALRISFEDLSLEKQNGKWTGGVDIAFVSQFADGRTLAATTKRITLDLTDENYAAKRREGLILEQMIAMKKGLSRVRIAVLDERSSATGSLTVTPQ